MDLRGLADEQDAILTERLDTLVPSLLDEVGIDCWVLIGREYAEGAVLLSMLPATWMTARRRTILVLTRDSRMAISRYPMGDFTPVWDPDEQPDQWACLAHLLSNLDPGTIAVETDAIQAAADGLTVTQHGAFLASLPEHLRHRVVSGGFLGVRWLETRLPRERTILAEATGIAHDILRRGLSSEGVTPGSTTTADLEWWYRQTVHDAGFESWFHPTVTYQRSGQTGLLSGTIEHGDLLHVDFGIRYRGLCTDQQEHAYVLRAGETDAPVGLQAGLARATRIQDLLLEEFVTGRTGNGILAEALAKAKAQDLATTIYTHSIGTHGHGAGMTIGLWDRQDGVPGAGEHPLHPNTAYSIELSGESVVGEWGGQTVRFMLEQDGWFDGTTVTWLDGRQEDLWLI